MNEKDINIIDDKYAERKAMLAAQREHYYIDAPLASFPQIDKGIHLFIPSERVYAKKNNSIPIPELIIEALAQGWDVETVCQLTSIHRNTFYYWLKTDYLFAANVERARAVGNYLAGGKLWKKVFIEENLDAIKFYLTHRTTEYKDKKEEQPRMISEEALKSILEIFTARGNLLPIKKDEELKDENNGTNRDT